jgi:predicted MFS family arabinose efflux permease
MRANLTECPPGILHRGWNAWGSMSFAARRLLSARFWRSISQGTLVVDLALYLSALGWSGAAIGMVLSAGGLVGAGLNLAVGVTSDQLRRKPFLMAYEGLTCICALVAMSQSSPLLLAPAIALAGFGRGANGAAGPFAPAEQAWLAETVEPSRQGFVYSLNTAFGFVGMALGAMAASLPSLWMTALGHAGGFRPLFGLVLLGNVINLVLLATTPEVHRSNSRRTAPCSSSDRESDSRAQENRFLRHLVGLNALNGGANGLTGPLISYWFAMRFQIGPSFIGPVMAVTFFATALAALVTARVSPRVGLVRSVVWGRTGGLLLLVLMPMMPIYGLAALAYLLRSALNRGTVGARQALVVSAVHDDRRGFAVSMNALSMQVPMSIGPMAAGAMIGAGWFMTPFYVAAALQGLYVFLYGRAFASVEQSAMAEDEG